LQKLCKDVDGRRDDMKWLVQKLDQLVSHRADDAGLSEQKRLEGLITRYKSMIPVIEMTMLKLDLYSRSYAFRDDVQRVLPLLEEIQRSTVDDKFPDTEDAVADAVDKQEETLRRLDAQRAAVLGLLQRGKELQRDTACPEFVAGEVRSLEGAWTDVYSRATERLKNLRDHLAVWQEYKMNKAHMLNLIDETEIEMKRVIPIRTHVEVRQELKSKANMRDELRKATDEVLGKMKELAETLNSVSSEEQQAALEKEVKMVFFP
jgi:nesprin-1